MNHQTILCCVVALILGMLLANMLKNVCGCKLTEGQCQDTESTNCIDCIKFVQKNSSCNKNPDGLGCSNKSIADKFCMDSPRFSTTESTPV